MNDTGLTSLPWRDEPVTVRQFDGWGQRRTTVSFVLQVMLLMLISVATSDMARAGDNTYGTLKRGLYLTRAGDCAACHTVDEERPFAGNWALPTPFGTIYSSNLTPDADTGLGLWTADDFYRAMHEGIDAEGQRLYPAFPYTSYTKLTREDSDAIYAYLQTLEPVRNVVREPEFPPPLNWRFMMSGWNLLNFEAGTYEEDDSQSAEWNRGNYLVNALGHCGLCHSPKNLIGAEKTDEARFTGGMAEGWWAPSLTSAERDGLGGWTDDQLVAYLKHGRNDKTAAFGPMAKVIQESTRYLEDADLQAIATYLGSVPGEASEQAEKTKINEQTRQLGRLVYDTQCSACHAPEGEGVPNMFGALAGSALTQAADPTTVVRMILEGAQSVPTESHPTPHAMPAYGWKLSDAEIAAVTTYVRNAFGNVASVVDTDFVSELREAH